MIQLPPLVGQTFDPKRLPDFIGPEDRRNLLQLFLDSSFQSLKKLKRILALPGCDKVTLKEDLHGLKGASVSVGALGIAQVAKAIELTLDQWSDAEILEALGHLEATLLDTQTAMQPWLK